MIRQSELLEAIRSCEASPMSYQNCEKLATFYTIYDHLFTEPVQRIEKIRETVVETDGESEFLKSINGMPADAVWSIMDELLSTLKIINPRLYDTVLEKIFNM